MPGLYLHIPFCKQACHYCNFHFSTSLRQKAEMVRAIMLELEIRRNYLPEAPLSSVYFGGGTPSLLETAELAQIFEQIRNLYGILPDAEITLEANPDDLSPTKLAELRNYTPVNRLSIGIQSFQEADLRWMNRAHSAAEARTCLDDARQAGFQNLTIDLIYGAPSTSDADWAENVRIALEADIPHLSCYCLTVEPGTALAHFVQKGRSEPVDEEKAARQFEYLEYALHAAGYLHYEISNFALPGRLARHNTSYWQGESYLGIGPSAHSFDGVSRQWNVANNARYIRAMADRNPLFERELLTPAQRYNEYVMTGLRTMWGCDRAKLAAFGDAYFRFFEEGIRPHLEQGLVLISADNYFLSPSGRLLADRIASDLFWVD